LWYPLLARLRLQFVDALPAKKSLIHWNMMRVCFVRGPVGLVLGYALWIYGVVQIVFKLSCVFTECPESRHSIANLHSHLMEKFAMNDVGGLFF
jgi:hypothetical protein